jgi:hypothetical protein
MRRIFFLSLAAGLLACGPVWAGGTGPASGCRNRAGNPGPPAMSARPVHLAAATSVVTAPAEAVGSARGQYGAGMAGPGPAAGAPAAWAGPVRSRGSAALTARMGGRDLTARAAAPSESSRPAPAAVLRPALAPARVGKSVNRAAPDWSGVEPVRHARSR